MKVGNRIQLSGRTESATTVINDKIQNTVMNYHRFNMRELVDIINISDDEVKHFAREHLYI